MSKKKSSKLSLVEAMSQTRTEHDSGQRLVELPEMEDGQSAEELALESGISVKTIRERLRALLIAGNLEVGKKRTKDLIGRDVWVPCYRMIEPGE